MVPTRPVLCPSDREFVHLCIAGAYTDMTPRNISVMEQKLLPERHSDHVVDVDSVV